MVKHKRNRNRVSSIVRLVIWTLALFMFMTMIVLPTGIAMLAKQPNGIPPEWAGAIRGCQILQKFLLKLFIIVWVFFLGGCFASFLNVVAWRVPRGRGISGSSKCPFCNTRLPFTANLPVYGWLSSAGRCRSCKLPIPPRYLIVEIVLGTIFLLIAVVGLFCGGWYLPSQVVESKWGIAQFVLEPNFVLLRIVGYHLIVACLIYLLALVRLEDKPIPKSIIVSAIVAVIGFQILWPSVQQVGWPQGSTLVTPADTRFWTTLIAGGVAGAFGGCLIWTSYSNRERISGDAWRECLFGMLTIGLAFGFQFALSVQLGVLILDALLILLGDVQGSLFQMAPIFKIGVLALIGLLCWQLSGQFEFWPGPTSAPISLSIAIGTSLVLAFGIGGFRISSQGKPMKS